jgi:hypothetical protein
MLLQRRESLFLLVLHQPPCYRRLCWGRALVLSSPASSSSFLVAADPPLTQRRATNPVSDERATAPALAVDGPPSPGPDLVVCGSAPSGCAAVTPRLASPPPPEEVITRYHPPLLGMPALSLLRRIASRRWRFGSTLSSTSSLALMRWRNLGRCRLKNFRSVSFFSTKSSSCRSLWSHAWCLRSSRSF